MNHSAVSHGQGVDLHKAIVECKCVCLQVWDDMRAAGVEPNSYVYVALINACERSSDWRRALRVFNTMKVRPTEVYLLHPPIWNDVVVCVLQRGSSSVQQLLHERCIFCS